MKTALTIAGSDSGGGAGIQADLKTFQKLGVFGTSVVTAVTAQNTLGVSDWDAVRPGLVEAQLDAVASDLEPQAFKTGMLGNAAIVRIVAAGITRHQLTNYVLDPVMVSSSGVSLLEPDARGLVLDLLLPLAALVTPNLAEAETLTGLPVRTKEEMEAAGRALLDKGAEAALIKGGHLEADAIVDVLVAKGGVRAFEHRRIASRATHGTGCVLSAAITAALALGKPLETAVEDAVDLVQRAITSAPGLGHGKGPLGT